MKKWIGKLLPTFLICAVLIAAFAIGIVYFNFISERINEDSSKHMKEIYGQVNRSFGSFVDRNWSMLDDWNDYFELADYDADTIREYIAKEKKERGFSRFYFVASDKTAMTFNGTTYELTLDPSFENSPNERVHLMTGEKIGDREITLFVAPVQPRIYKYADAEGNDLEFEFNAIAISYTNAELAQSLNSDAFPGEAKCFVIHTDGKVLLSTQASDSIFSNYLAYLDAASDLSDEQFSKMRGDMQNGTSDIIQCEIGGVVNRILYQPVGIQDYFLLSVVPQSTLNAGFLAVQKTTITVLIVIFLLIAFTIAVLFVLRSYNQSRKSKTELQYRERMFDVLSNSVDDIFIMIDTNTETVDYISPNLERLLGVSLEEAHKSIRVLQKCAINFNVIMPKAELDAIPLNGNKYWECEYMHQKTGETRWYRMTIYHMSIQNVEKYITVMSDRTLEQRMNKQLQQAFDAAKSANEAKSNFLSNMSHDIRTPMNAIVGFSVLLEKDADDSEKVREYTRKIMASSHHLLSLINDVLDMSKIESGKTSLNVDKFSLPELLEEINIIIMPQAKAKTQDFSIHVHGNPPEHIVGDKLRLNQILINLLSNAVKYTQTGGKIDFSVGLVDNSSGYAKLRFVVKDNGIGMSKDFLSDIFNPFSREINSVTNKIQGTGLGMAITKNLVDLMGGIIAVESEPGKGSTFTVELSFALPEQDEDDEWYKHKITHMLVCDDEEDICANILEMMHDTGVDVSCVTSGAAAVESAVRAHKNQDDFDVILLDWKMPEMDGVETARRIRKEVGEHVPILVLTSYDWSDIETEAREAGINAFMPKPFFTSTFWQTIKPLFDSIETQLKPVAPDQSALNGMHFLVAEDNELNAEILTEMLSIEGATCEVASNGEEAVEKFVSAPPDAFDMILMDVQMPVMNGYEATQKIRSLNHPRAKTIPILAMTANTFAEDVRRSLDSGMNGHLAKPIDMNIVRDTIASLKNKENKEKQ